MSCRIASSRTEGRMRAGATIRRAGANHIVDCCGLANRAGARVPFRRSMTLPSSPTSRERLPVSGHFVVGRTGPRSFGATAIAFCWASRSAPPCSSLPAVGLSTSELGVQAGFCFEGIASRDHRYPGSTRSAATVAAPGFQVSSLALPARRPPPPPLLSHAVAVHQGAQFGVSLRELRALGALGVALAAVVHRRGSLGSAAPAHPVGVRPSRHQMTPGGR